MAERRKDKKREQKIRARKKRLQAVRTKVLAQDLPDNVVVVSDPAGYEKMSQVLLDFIEPYRDLWQTDDELDKFLTLAMIAWNASLTPGPKGNELIRSTLETLPPDVRPPVQNVLDDMMRRKQMYFANNQRAIIKYLVTKTPTGPHVDVLSMLPPS